MASTVESAPEEAPEAAASVSQVVAPAEAAVADGVRSFYRLEGGRLISCEPGEAQIIAYVSPTIDDEADLQEHYNIDYHTLQSSLDPDELSRLEPRLLLDRRDQPLIRRSFLSVRRASVRTTIS